MNKNRVRETNMEMLNKFREYNGFVQKYAMLGEKGRKLLRYIADMLIEKGIG